VLVVHENYTGCANKKHSPRKNAVFQPWQYGFEPNFRCCIWVFTQHILQIKLK